MAREAAPGFTGHGPGEESWASPQPAVAAGSGSSGPPHPSPSPQVPPCVQHGDLSELQPPSSAPHAPPSVQHGWFSAKANAMLRGAHPGGVTAEATTRFPGSSHSVASNGSCCSEHDNTKQQHRHKQKTTAGHFSASAADFIERAGKEGRGHKVRRAGGWAASPVGYWTARGSRMPWCKGWQPT